MKNRVLATAMLVFSLASVTTTTAQQFIDAPQFQVDGSPKVVATGDFNGDAILDLATGKVGGPTPISILLGTGGGGFELGQELGDRFSASYGLTVGDWNRDGVLDLASVDGNSTLQIYLGVGDGTFQAGSPYTVGAVGITSADLNSDGVLDLIAADGVFGMSVLLGLGDGTFGAPVMYTFKHESVGDVAVGDLNGDGNPDVVAVATSTGHGDLLVFLGNRDGSLQPAVAYSTAQEGNGIVIGDFNLDGILDLSTSGSQLAILFGKGDGTFGPAQQYIGPGGGVGVTMADIDGDGSPDLLELQSAIAFGFGPPSAVALWRNRGDGTLRLPILYGVGQDPRDIMIGDFNNDGQPDVVTANNVSDTVSVLLNSGEGQLISRRQFETGLRESNGAEAIAVGYIDKDNNLDAVITDFDGGGIVVLPGNADGTFRQPNAFPAKLFPEAVTLADVNRDGWTDIIVGGGEGVSILLGNGIGEFQPPVHYQAGPGVQAVATGDVNNDGLPDVITGDYAGHAVSVLLNDGTGKFGKQIYNYTNYRVTALAVGDLNNDGKLDVATINHAVGMPVGEGSSTVLLGNGDGTFTVQHTFRFGVGHAAGSVVIADVNRDGKPDVVTLGDQLRVYPGQGDGTFGNPIITEVSRYGGPGVVGDFNRDGKLDALVLVTDIQGHFHTFLLLGNGDGTFGPAQAFSADNYSAIASGDFNHDGALDAVSFGACCIDVLLNTGAR
ncbi:MAG: VCBS repeat-containing protein [Acidobacteriales bacterium]|nr:VCBS repeat-containing protein [Terriglobales bacterium]